MLVDGAAYKVVRLSPTYLNTNEFVIMPCGQASITNNRLFVNSFGGRELDDYHWFRTSPIVKMEMLDEDTFVIETESTTYKLVVIAK